MEISSELKKSLENGWKEVRAHSIHPSIGIIEEYSYFSEDSDEKLCENCFIYKLTNPETELSITEVIDIRIIDMVKLTESEYGKRISGIMAEELFMKITSERNFKNGK